MIRRPVTRARRSGFITRLQLYADLVQSAALTLLGIHKANRTLPRAGNLNGTRPAGSLQAHS